MVAQPARPSPRRRPQRLRPEPVGLAVHLLLPGVVAGPKPRRRRPAEAAGHRSARCPAASSSVGSAHAASATSTALPHVVPSTWSSTAPAWRCGPSRSRQQRPASQRSPSPSARTPRPTLDPRGEQPRRQPDDLPSEPGTVRLARQPTRGQGYACGIGDHLTPGGRRLPVRTAPAPASSASTAADGRPLVAPVWFVVEDGDARVQHRHATPPRGARSAATLGWCSASTSRSRRTPSCRSRARRRSRGPRRAVAHGDGDRRRATWAPTAPRSSAGATACRASCSCGCAPTKVIAEMDMTAERGPRQPRRSWSFAGSPRSSSAPQPSASPLIFPA